MPIRHASALRCPSPAPFAAALLGGLLLLLPDPLQDAIANGDTRSLSFVHMHTNETLNVTFKRDGRYDEAALKQLNWFLRDWRRDEQTRMDPHLYDLLWDVHREVRAKGPITIVSAYRAPQTNAMLRSRSRGVAQHSQHMVGKAIDFYIPDADLAEMRAVALRLQRGGVGFYPSSGAPFIHVDTGGVRHWPRVTREQLAKIFPDGKTVHIPSDGKPMPGFALAMAEIEARGGSLGATAIAARDAGAVEPQPVAGDGGRLQRFFASLFAPKPAKDEETDEETAVSTRSNRTRIPTSTVVASADPPSTPAKPIKVASANPVPPHGPQLKWSEGPAAATPAQVPFPPARPADLIETTASLPDAITGGKQEQPKALAYASAGPAFGPLPPAHIRLLREAEAGAPQLTRAAEPAAPIRPRTELQHGSGAPAIADAAKAPAELLRLETVEMMAALRHPDPGGLSGLLEPLPAAFVRFTDDLVDAPSTVQFAGAAIAPPPAGTRRSAAVGSGQTLRN